jgi:lysophospholipase L1-like esterase
LKRPFLVALAVSLGLAAAGACARDEPPRTSDTAATAGAGVPTAAPAAPMTSPAGAVASSSPLPAPTPAPAPARTRYVLAAIGDSFTDPRSHGGIYLKVLAEKCPKSRFESFGVGGNMVNMMRRRFLRDVYGDTEEPRWTHVLVLGGLGDALSNITAKRTAGAVQRDLAWMVAESRKRGARAIVLSLPPWAGFRDYDGARAQMARDVNAWISAEAAAGNIDATFDTRPVLSCGNVERLCDKFASPDRLHWNEAGQRAVGEALHQALFSDCE